MEKSLFLERVFQDLPFYERFAQAAAAGFNLVELCSWTDLDLSQVGEELVRNGLGLSALYGSAGHDLSRLESHAGFMEHLSQSIAVAKSFGCKKIIIESNAGANGDGDPLDAGETNIIAREDLKSAAIATRVLMSVAQKCERTGVTLYLKPPRGLSASYSFLSSLRLSGNVVAAVNSPGLRLLLDASELWRSHRDPDAPNVMRRISAFLGYVHIGSDVIGDDWPAEFAWFKKNIASFYEFDGTVGLFYPAALGDQELLRSFREL